jgi:hypothetical protein
VSLDFSGNPVINNIEIGYNQLNEVALNALFRTLPDLSNYPFPSGEISIPQNPGTYNCHISFAEDRGWRVYTTWSSNIEQYIDKIMNEIIFLWRNHEKSFY